MEPDNDIDYHDVLSQDEDTSVFTNNYNDYTFSPSPSPIGVSNAVYTSSLPPPLPPFPGPHLRVSNSRKGPSRVGLPTLTPPPNSPSPALNGAKGQIWTITVQSWKQLYSKKEQDIVTVFNMLVSDGQFQWIIWKRFKHILDLHEKLSERYQISATFPARRPKIFIDEEYLTERMNALNVYFNGLDQQLFETSEELKVFVGLYSERDLRPIPTDAPSLRIPIDNIELQQVLVSEVEYFIVYSTQKVYIQSTLETIRVALSTLDDLKTEISSIFGTQERLEFIKTNNSSRKSAVQALKETQHVLTLLIEEKEVQQHFAYDIFKTILVYIDAGLDWDNSLDGMISKELTHCSNLLWKKIKNFEDEIEASVATILLKSGAEQQKVFDQLKVTEARIEQFVQMLKAPTLQRPDPTALATLESLITTVQNSRNIVNPDKQQIKAVEADVFSLLEEVNRASSSDDIKSLEPRLLKQVKSVATLRASIEKKIEKKDNPVENKVLVNQVEDLQENLADIQFTLTEKKKNLMPDISEDKNHRTEVLLSKKKKEKSFYDDL